MRSKTTNNTKTGTRISELDGLRGIAIFLVVAYHFAYGGFAADDKSILAVSVHYMLSLAWSGVDLFFVLSGFLIGGILIDQRDTQDFFKTFYIRRVCRTFPLYYLWLILFVILSNLFPQENAPSWRLPLFDHQGVPCWLNWFFLQNFQVAKNALPGSAWFGATWSLAVEEQFYLLLPLLIWLLPKKKLLLVLVLLIPTVPLFRLFLFLFHPNIFMYVLLPCRADALLLGVLCAVLVRNVQVMNWLKNNQQRLVQILAVLILGTGYLMVVSNGKDIFQVACLFEITTFGYSWLACLYACLLLIVVTAQNGVFVEIVRLSLLRQLGTIAYGVYLIHIPVILLTHGLVLGKDTSITNLLDGLVTLLAFLLTIFLAAISWRFFEKPIINWGRSFSYSQNDRQPSE